MHANHREDVEQIGAGDIAAAVGLKQTTTGDTLCDQTHPILLEAIDFPEPVIDVAVEPKTKADQDKLATALAAPGRGGPDLPRAHQRGDRPDDHRRHGRAAPGDHRRPADARVQGRRQRRQAAGRLPRDDAQARSRACAASSSARPAAAASTATSVIDLEPNEPGAGYEFENKIVGGAIPREYISSVDAGIQEAMESGVLAGFPVVDVKVTLVDGSLPRRRLVRDGVQGRRLDGLQGGVASAPSRCCSSR